MQTYIIQVIGPTHYMDTEFLIDGKRRRAKLACEAVRQHLEEQGNSPKVILLTPESLVTFVAEDAETAATLLRDWRKLASSISKECTQRGWVEDGATVSVIQSTGQQKHNNYILSIDNHVDNIITHLTLELINTIPADSKIFYITTTGLNIYVIAALEAIRQCQLYHKLATLIEEKTTETELLFHPQVYPDTETPIQTTEYSTRVFFEFKKASANELFNSPQIRRQLHETLQDINREVNTVELCFNAVKYCIPLAIQHLVSNQIHTQTILDKLKQVLEIAEQQRNITVENKHVHVKRHRVVKNIAINILVAAALAHPLGRIKEITDKTEGKLEELAKTFKTVYDKLQMGINQRFLEREVEAILEKAKIQVGEEKLLEELSEGRGSKDKKRNFFAHAGFLKEYTLIKNTGEGITARYHPSRLDEIRNWLLNP